jgi:hypothetical protein
MHPYRSLALLLVLAWQGFLFMPCISSVTRSSGIVFRDCHVQPTYESQVALDERIRVSRSESTKRTVDSIMLAKKSSTIDERRVRAASNV